jgi:hypothetical protein
MQIIFLVIYLEGVVFFFDLATLISQIMKNGKTNQKIICKNEKKPFEHFKR